MVDCELRNMRQQFMMMQPGLFKEEHPEFKKFKKNYELPKLVYCPEKDVSQKHYIFLLYKA